MPYAVSEVVFTIDVLLPDGRFGRSIASSDSVKLTRDGDALVCQATIPSNEDRGFPVVINRDYNWANVAYSTRAPEPKPVAKSTR